jgi:hypothetical protein
MQLSYFIPFKAQDGINAEMALREKLINIEGEAMDTSVNQNKWQVPAEDLDFFVETLQNAQLRVDHAESALAVIGKVSLAQRVGDKVLFRAEVGDTAMIEKILRNYVSHVSAQVDSDDVECSKCKRPTRKEGMLVHLCPGAWEIVHKPKVRELSIVASPAYKETQFHPVGFAAAMNEGQWEAIVKRQDETSTIIQTLTNSKLLEGNKDVGSKGNLQEPENKNLNAQEVKLLSEHNAQQAASPQKAQGVVNVAPGESAPKQVTYEELMNQLTTLQNKISSAEDADMDAMQKRVSDLEAEVAKRASKKLLTKKISDLQQKLKQAQEEGEEEGAAKGDSGIGAEEEAEAIKKASSLVIPTGKGIVGALAPDELNKDALGDFDWFKDILKARSTLTGMK